MRGCLEGRMRCWWRGVWRGERDVGKGVLGGENEMLMRGCLEGRTRCWWGGVWRGERDVHKGLAVPVSYKTPTVLLIWFKSGKSLVRDRGNLHKREKIHCHLRYWYFVAIKYKAHLFCDVIINRLCFKIFICLKINLIITYRKTITNITIVNRGKLIYFQCLFKK
jgi:hypothetical protein